MATQHCLPSSTPGIVFTRMVPIHDAVKELHFAPEAIDEPDTDPYILTVQYEQSVIADFGFNLNGVIAS